MLDLPFGRDVAVLVVAMLIGTAVALATTPKGSSNRPVWAVRVYLWLFRAFPPFRAGTARTFSYREQFLAVFFLSAFIAFLIGAMAFGCSYRLGCQ